MYILQFASLKHLTLYHLSIVFYGWYNTFFFRFFFTEYRDGFPVPSTTDDLNTFDEEVFENCTRTVEVPLKPKNHRAVSIPNLSHIRSRLSNLQLASKLHLQGTCNDPQRNISLCKQSPQYILFG